MKVKVRHAVGTQEIDERARGHAKDGREVRVVRHLTALSGHLIY